jgi:hypothetical protein
MLSSALPGALACVLSGLTRSAHGCLGRLRGRLLGAGVALLGAWRTGCVRLRSTMAVWTVSIAVQSMLFSGGEGELGLLGLSTQ